MCLVASFWSSLLRFIFLISFFCFSSFTWALIWAFLQPYYSVSPVLLHPSTFRHVIWCGLRQQQQQQKLQEKPRSLMLPNHIHTNALSLYRTQLLHQLWECALILFTNAACLVHRLESVYMMNELTKKRNQEERCACAPGSFLEGVCTLIWELLLSKGVRFLLFFPVAFLPDLDESDFTTSRAIKLHEHLLTYTCTSVGVSVCFRRDRHGENDLLVLFEHSGCPLCAFGTPHVMHALRPSCCPFTNSFHLSSSSPFSSVNFLFFLLNHNFGFSFQPRAFFYQHSGSGCLRERERKNKVSLLRFLSFFFCYL